MIYSFIEQNDGVERVRVSTSTPTIKLSTGQEVATSDVVIGNSVIGGLGAVRVDVIETTEE